MKRTLLAIGLALMLGTSVQAKTPKEVLEPYKAFQAALANKDRSLAAEKAYEAWQKAEELMGDSKTTGDLAANFASEAPRNLHNKAAWKKVMQAHKRAIDLSTFQGESADEVEIDRRTQYLAWLIPNLHKRESGAREKKYSPNRLTERIAELGMTGSTFEAESYALAAQQAMLDKKWDDVQKNSKIAKKIFDARTDGVVSLYEFAVPIYLARSYTERDQPIDAALSYQGLMTKLETTGGHHNGISGDAYAEWLRLRDEIIESNTADARAAKVINFTVPQGRLDADTPLVRKPPEIPSSFLRGSRSGFVKVVFNIDQKGHVVDPRITSSTKKSLHGPTLEALKSWRYSPNLPADRSQNIKTTVQFNLQGESGKLLPVGTEKAR